MNHYNQDMRNAMRAIRNPTPIDVYVVRYPGYLVLRADADAYKIADMKTKMNCLAYMNHQRDVLESFGAAVAFEGVDV